MLQAAEEEGDIRAAKRARAEQAAEMAEFDDNYNLQMSSTVEVRALLPCRLGQCMLQCVCCRTSRLLAVMEW